MAINSISGYSTTRITGLMSGLDTDALVEAAMQSQQAKLDIMYQNKTKLEWKQEAYTNVNTLISEFSDKYMSQLSEDNIFSTNVYKSYKVNISAEYSTYFSVTGTASAAVSRHQITQATLADYATVSGQQYRNRVAMLSGTMNANSQTAVTGTKTLADGAAAMTLEDLTYADGTKVFDFDNYANNISFAVNGKTFVFSKDQTLGEMMEAVNSSSANAAMSVVDGQIAFESTAKGAKAQLMLSNVAGQPLFGAGGAFGIEEGTVEAKSLINENMTLAEIAAATGKDLGMDANGRLQFEINGVRFSFTENDTLATVLQTVNDDANAQVTMTYNQAADQFALRSDLQGEGTTLTTSNIGSGKFFGSDGLSGILEDSTEVFQMIDRQKDTIASAASKMGLDLRLDDSGKFSFKVNGVEFSFNSTDTIEKMINTVNSNEEANALLTYSQITDSFVFTSKETGRDAKITVENANGTGAFGGAESFFGVAESTATGTDATLVIDGETITQSSNTFILDGMQFTLKTNFEAGNNYDNLGPASFTVEQDIDSVIEKVEAFVKDYNTLTQKLYEMIIEEPDRDYAPLTEAERADMSEEDIEAWEKEAKKGILRSDSTIKDLLSSLRMDLFQTVEGTGLSAYDIGLNTSSWQSGKWSGQITFDAEKFRAAMEKDADAVSRVMAQTSSSTDKSVKDAESGLVTRYSDAMSSFRSTIRNTNMQNLTDRIDDVNDSMDLLIQKMYDEQERLYAMYAQMETLMAEYQSQSQWLTQQLSSLG